MISPEFLEQFKFTALKRGYDEDAVQEALYLIIKRRGVDFLQESPPLVMKHLIRALNEARLRTANIHVHGKVSSVSVTLEFSEDLVETPVKPHNDRSWELDKLLNRAKLSNQQRQDFTFFMKGYSYKQIGDICGRSYQTVQQSIGSVKDKCIAVRTGCYNW